jgi:hypothetical protein
MCSVPIDERAVRHECDEGGEAPCWAHLLDDDGTLDPSASDVDDAPGEGGARPKSSS